MRRLEAQADREINFGGNEQNNDKEGASAEGCNKEDAARLKKQRRSFIVKRGTEEQRRLNERHKKRMEELVERENEARKEVQKRLQKVSKTLK